ncbi:hypothetical protein [Lacunimicrobium album]
MKQTKLLTIVSLLLISAAGFTAFVIRRSPGFQVSYHRARMKEARNEIYFPLRAKSRSSSGEDHFNDVWERFESELAKLVELEAIRHHIYRFENVQTPTPRSAEIFREQFRTQYPPSIHLTSKHPRIPEPLEIEVWHEWSDTPKWDLFIKGADVPSVEQDTKKE